MSSHGQTCWTTAEWANGPHVVAWLERQGYDLHRLDPATRKLVERWRAGCQASVWKVDELLIRFGRHLSELPSAAWLSGYDNGRRRAA